MASSIRMCFVNSPDERIKTYVACPDVYGIGESVAGESAKELARRRRQKAELLSRQAEMYEKGAEGEVRTASALSTLPVSEWTQLHDLRWPGRRFANIDHVVVGPGGIFVIDSKNWSGAVRVDRSTLRQNGRSREGAVAACADSAMAVSELLPTEYARLVTPVLCFVREDSLTGWARDVAICSTSTLQKLLLTRRPMLTPQQVNEVSLMLGGGLHSATSPREVALTPRASSQLRPANRRRPSTRRRRKPSLVRLAAVLFVASIAIFNPGVIVAIAEQLAAVLTNLMVPETTIS